MFPPHIISSRTLNLERERRSPRPRLSASSPNGVKDLVADISGATEGHLLSRLGRRMQNQRRWSLTASARHRRGRPTHKPPVMGGYIQGMRGRMPSNCLWYACQALFVGILLFSIGSVMSYLGFEADGVFTSNGTAVAGGRAYFYEDARGANVKFSKLSYAGPIIMGVGGFIIVAACVMTFEARDSAAKVGPAAYVASEEVSQPYPIITRPRAVKVRAEVRTIGTQTADSHASSDTLHIFDKKNLLETFRKFSRTVRQSSSKEDDIHRYPSAPNLLDEDDPNKPSDAPKPAAIAARRSSCLPKFRNRVPPVLHRQAMSIDCSSSSPFLPITSRSSNLSQTSMSTSPGGGQGHHTGSCGHIKARKGQGVHRSGVSPSDNRASVGDNVLSPNSQSTSRAGSSLSMDNSNSFGSGGTVRQGGSGGGGTVDLHLPNGMVTLNVIHTTGGSMLGGSSTCLRTLSPHPSYHSQSDDSCSFDMGSVKSDNILMPKSPMKPFKSFRSESFGRPTLVRQSKVDQAEIIYIPDSDEEQVEQQQPILEAEHESESDSN